MKAIARMLFSSLLLFCSTIVWAADPISITSEKTDSTKQVLTGDAVYQWVSEHLDSLANSYLMKSGNILDPDNVREELKSIGYNGLNVTNYMSYHFYVYCYPLFQGRIAYLQKEHPDITLYCLDNSHNQGGTRVSIEEAMTWDYTITEEMKQTLQDIMQKFINSGQLNAAQVRALTGR
jgi:hypothetical protein